ncbi:hypothetical protein [Defluviitalea saccharophila]|uniref:Uncharacterized protein n=1 Tax=Defluviitalea saccharophila TaxID=879970 RepID=A0ABZ2YAH1_9FIRM|nr:hypothetical protein [Candidatus Epulonipiscium sp.]
MSLQFDFDKLRNFAYDTLKPNISDSTDSRVPIHLTSTTGEKLLSTITLPLENQKAAVWLSATIGFRVNSPVPSQPPSAMRFRIWRGQPDTGTLVYSTTDSGQGGDSFGSVSRTTNLNHIDIIKTPCKSVTYTLTVEAFDIVSISIIGPITFTAAEIEL